MADPLEELRVLKTQLRELRWTTQVDSLNTIARESATGPGARGGISKATIGNLINPDSSTMPRWETFEIFIDTCLRLIDRAGTEPPTDGGDRRIWRLRYIRVRDALGEDGEVAEALDEAVEASTGFSATPDSGVAGRDSVIEGRWLILLTAAAVLAVVAVVVVWQVVGDERAPDDAGPGAKPSFCTELNGTMILDDSFTDVRSGWPQRPGRSEYVSGSYRLTAVSGPQVIPANAPVPMLTNSCMEAVVRHESGSGGIALWCRGEPGDLTRRYLFTVTTTGQWGIAMGQPEQSTVAVLASQDSLPGLNLDQQTRIGASCRNTAEGVDLVVSVNGHRIRHLDPESRLTSGTVGIVGWSWLLEPGATSSYVVEETQIWDLPATVGG
ncbi:hypothetical protein BJY24_004978 [Nocardia transvalensis]|uniref:Uncharacterized protein n=1 Tax=Nocardia transvalensis TaxID=37333 RepID=A0A7W9UK47_9NOCA|nr:hypothetical protein [Nocardia transvalensis]MBB5916066.1 hypothetical protein [Nocardia transvalensis]